MDQTVPGANADPAEGARAPLALKIAVIVMGVLLVAGFAVVIITIAYRAANPPDPDAVAAARSEGRFETSVPVPAGAKIVGTTIADGRALITIERPDGTHELLVLDHGRGELRGRFLLTPE